MSHELYKKHRPVNLGQVVGNEATIQSVESMFQKNRIPHAILLCGPSGCGKTTIGRIIAKRLGCHESEFTEVDSGQFRGVDTARELREQMVYAPQQGSVRVWLIDEAHMQTKDQQNAMLKALEDTPEHVYFMLATTDPDKLLKAIRTRCTTIEVDALTAEQIAKKVLYPVCLAEKRTIDKTVLLYIGEHCSGSARAALVQLDAVWDIKEPAEQIAALKRMTVDEEAVTNLANLLLKGIPWPKLAPMLKDVVGEPESIRRGVLGYMSAGACGWLANNPSQLKRAGVIMTAFEKNWYDTGRVGLTLSCMEACGAL